MLCLVLVMEFKHRMLKKAGFIITLLFISIPSYARFYVGAGFGPEAGHFNQTAYFRHHPDANVKDTEQFAGRGVFGSLFGGYDVHCRQYYLAGEVNVNASSDEFHSSNNELIHQTFSTTRYKMRNGIGLSVLPGLLFNTLLIYARVGIANTNFQISTADDSLANIDRRLNGFRYGIGVKQDFSANFSGRLEYSHVDYETTHFLAIPNATTTKRTAISPSTSLFEFAIIYSFC